MQIALIINIAFTPRLEVHAPVIQTRRFASGLYAIETLLTLATRLIVQAAKVMILMAARHVLVERSQAAQWASTAMLEVRLPAQYVPVDLL